jgi:hypothetical protein
MVFLFGVAGDNASYEYGRKNMLNIVRRSQIIGWIAIDSSTASRFGSVDEVWLNESYHFTKILIHATSLSPPC